MTQVPLQTPGSVLIVEDVAANIDLLMEALGDEFAVSVALDGAGALEIVSSAPPELILLDIMMPGMDGYEVCRRLKRNPVTADIPVIFLTALTEEEDEARGLHLGALDYIVKPFRPEIVRARVRNHILLRRAQLELIAEARSMEIANEELRRLERLRDDLVHMVVHDMRSPLMVVTGALEMLEAQRSTHEALINSPSADREAVLADIRQRMGSIGDRLQGANTAARDLCGMVNTLLDVSRLEAHQMPLRLRDCALDEVIRQSLEQVRPLFGARRVAMSATGDLLMARCDREITSRILQNLLSNSLRYTAENGSIAIELAPDGDNVRFTVRDDGPGIPAEHRQRIFEKFGQGPLISGYKRSTGLGLTFCRLAAEAQGGRIELLDEETQRGAAFCVWLPAPSTVLRH